jgi:succinate dehydrogenase hydrophobic anchor subunit
MALLDNDRLSHWFAGAVFTWVMIFLIWGVLVFHLWLKVPTATIAEFTGIGFALQLAITPWLFSARATRQNPSGQITQRAAAVTVLLYAEALLFFLLCPTQLAQRPGVAPIP